MIAATGIYMIVCTGNDMFYVGSAVNMRSRWMQHLRELKRGNHANKRMQGAFKKYGENAFFSAAVEIVGDKKELICVEQRWIDATCAVSSGFNICRTAGSTLGLKASEETKAKMSASHKGRKMPPMSEEQKEVLRKANTGRKPTEEARRKMSEALKKRVRKKETYEKAAEKNRGSRRSEETRRLMSEKAFGRKHSEETIAKMRAAKIGKKIGPMSEEQKAKLSEARKRWLAKQELIALEDPSPFIVADEQQ